MALRGLISCAVVLLLSTTAMAQWSAVTSVCNSSFQFRNLLPSEFSGNTFYFEGDINNMAEFEYRLIATDGKPLGLQELYDFDEGDGDGINFECFIPTSVDNTTCWNNYLANGQTILVSAQRKMRFGFAKCPDYDASVFSQSLSLQIYYRPMTPSPADPLCSGFLPATPTTYCGNVAV